MNNLELIKEISVDVYNFIERNNMEVLPLGVTNLENGCYVNVQEYDTVPHEMKEYEAHEAYLDIQYLISGEEVIAMVPVTQLTVSKEYDAARDVVFFKNDQKGEAHVLKAGDFLVCNVGEGHMPGLNNEGVKHVKKAVFKVPVKR